MTTLILPTVFFREYAAAGDPVNNNYFNAIEQKTADLSIPVAVAIFPGEIYRAPRSWAECAQLNLNYFNVVANGGRFAVWEQPLLFSQQIRATFRSLR